MENRLEVVVIKSPDVDNVAMLVNAWLVLHGSKEIVHVNTVVNFGMRNEGGGGFVTFLYVRDR